MSEDTTVDLTALPQPIRIGTRGSELARTQSGHVRQAIEDLGGVAELTIVKTAGDHNRHDPVEKIGVGVFTQALRHALREGECDLIVHSFKDLPTVPEEDMVVIAVPPRVDPREVVISVDSVPLLEAARRRQSGYFGAAPGFSAACTAPRSGDFAVARQY